MLNNGKKKTTNPVVFTGYDNATQSNLIQEQVQQIPNYEDAGVKYQGKFKVKKAQNEYELKSQETRFNVLILSGAAAGSTTTYTRSRPQTKYYCTKMMVQFRNVSAFGATSYFILSDVKGTSASPVFYFVPNETTGTIVLDFSDSPRLFEGNQFGIYSPYGMALGEYFVFNLYGWEEQQ